MLTSLRSTAVHHGTLIQRAFFGVALVYAAIGVVLNGFLISPPSASSPLSLLALLVAGVSPLALMLILIAKWTDRLDRAERRPLLLAAGAAALLLLPLLSSVLPCSAR